MSERTSTGAHPASERFFVALLLFIGVSALAGGSLLVIRPDGSLLQASLSALDGAPFHDWRTPGLLLAGLVGAGFVVAACLQWLGCRYAGHVSLLAGLGLLMFEAAELMWLGFQPLEAVMALAGVLVVAKAWRQMLADERDHRRLERQE